MQLWVKEGANAAPRKMTMTMKWEGGSPRRTAVMDWEIVSDLDTKVFDFKAPEGAQEIRFFGSE